MIGHAKRDCEYDFDYEITPVFEELIGGKVLLGWRHRCKCNASYVDGLSIPQVVFDDVIIPEKYQSKDLPPFLDRSEQEGE